MKHPELPSLEDIKQAALLLEKRGLSSPLIPSNDNNILLKLDCTLPGGSYKIRGVEYFAENITNRDAIQVLSAGNLALAAALRLKKDNIHCETIVPEGISQIKQDGLIQAGASIQEKPFDVIWEMVLNDNLRQSSQFLHPFNKYLLAGYATIILELQKAHFTQGTLVIPYGLGGLAIALAHAIELLTLDIKLAICEVKGFSPFLRAKSADQPISGNKLKSFIEAMGTPAVIPDIFQYLKNRVDYVIEVTEEEVKREIILAHCTHGIQIEGAAGASLAAANKLSMNPIVSLLTGSNISKEVLLNWSKR